MRENVINARLLFERFILAINFRKKITVNFPEISELYNRKCISTKSLTYTHTHYIHTFERQDEERVNMVYLQHLSFH